MIISNDTLKQHSRLLMVCPITNTVKGHPFHVLLDERTQTTGTVLCDQVRNPQSVHDGCGFCVSRGSSKADAKL